MKKLFALVLAVAMLLTGVVASAEELACKKIGMTVYDFANPYFVTVYNGAKARCDELGIELIINDPKSDVSAQINALENFITMEVDAIICSALDTAAAEDVLQRAKEAGIKIVSQSSCNDTRDVWVSAEEFNMGWTNGRGLGEWLVEKYGADSTPTVAVFGWDVISTQVLRGDGMVAGILECVPGAKVIRQNANTPQQGQEVADSVLQANPDLCGIVCLNDAGAIGAYSAVQAANKDNEDFYIGGIDATAEAISIIAGDCAFRATVDLIPYENGAIDVDLCVALCAGEEVEDPYVIPAKLVNIDNIGEYIK